MRRKIILGLMLVLLINFLAFLFSYWPYSKPGKTTTVPNESKSKVVTDVNIVKSNFKIYITISVASVVIAVAGAYYAKKKGL